MVEVQSKVVRWQDCSISSSYEMFLIRVCLRKLLDQLSLNAVCRQKGWYSSYKPLSTVQAGCCKVDSNAIIMVITHLLMSSEWSSQSPIYTKYVCSICPWLSKQPTKIKVHERCRFVQGIAHALKFWPVVFVALSPLKRAYKMGLTVR